MGAKNLEDKYCTIPFCSTPHRAILAVFSSSCYNKMAVKETTPSPGLLFLKVAGSRLQIGGLKPKEILTQTGIFRCF